MNKSGQILPALIILALAILIFIFAAPILFGVINSVGTGGASGFVARSYPWFILIALIFIGIKLFSSGEALF